MLVVLDTSAFISAIRSNKGAAGEVLRLILNGSLTSLLDLKLACEYRDVAFRPQHVTASGLSREQIETVITRLEAISIPVIVDVMHRPLSRDEDDNMVLDIAINGNADVIVTNNIRDFAAAAVRYNIQVLAPGELLAELRLRRQVPPMQITENDTAAIDIFPLRLAPSLRKQAEELSQKDGVDLNQFINLAVEHALAQVQHDKWVAGRRKPTPEYMAAALAILDHDNGNEPDPGDELPEDYVSVRFSPEYKNSAGRE